LRKAEALRAVHSMAGGPGHLFHLTSNDLYCLVYRIQTSEL
jgi:hypothetical protein